MTKSKQSLSKKVNLNDFSNAISPLGAVLTFAFCLLFFMFVLQPTTYNTRFAFELTKQLSMGSFQAYQFSCSEYETLLSVVAGIVIGMCQFEFLHRKAYLTIPSTVRSRYSARSDAAEFSAVHASADRCGTLERPPARIPRCTKGNCVNCVSTTTANSKFPHLRQTSNGIVFIAQ